MTDLISILCLFFLPMALYCAFWFAYGFFGHLWAVYKERREARRRVRAREEWREVIGNWNWINTLLGLEDGSEPLEEIDPEDIEFPSELEQSASRAPKDEEIHRWIDGKSKR